MSTTIIVAPDSQLRTQNAVAATIASFTQAQLEAASLMDDVFQELFETVPLFSLFDIDRLDRDRFMRLFNASRDARNRYSGAGPKGLPPFESFHQVLGAWDEMLTLMQADDRFNS